MASSSGSGAGAGSASVNFSISSNMGASTPDAPCLSCVQDPACWQNPKVRTAQNFISVCRIGHGVFFLAYALLLLIVVIMVWLTSNGSINSNVNAWVCTFIAVVVIILMGLHWYLYVKGVIPECCTNEGCTTTYEEPEAAAGLSAAFAVQSGANTNIAR